MSDISHINRMNDKYNITDLNLEINTRKQNKQNPVFYEEYKEKCLSTKFFSLNLCMSNKIKIEVIFFSLNDFKIWAKNLDYLIKNKYKLNFFKR